MAIENRQELPQLLLIPMKRWRSASRDVGQHCDLTSAKKLCDCLCSSVNESPDQNSAALSLSSERHGVSVLMRDWVSALTSTCLQIRIIRRAPFVFQNIVTSIIIEMDASQVARTQKLFRSLMFSAADCTLNGEIKGGNDRGSQESSSRKA